jgi:cysteinyl-tRNA synthetase
LAYELLTNADQSHVFADEPPPTCHWHDAFLADIENDLNMPRALSVVWAVLRSPQEDATTKLRLLLDWDRILGFGLKTYLQSDRPKKKQDPQTYLAAVSPEVAQQVRQREALRQSTRYVEADSLRRELNAEGYDVRDTKRGALVLPRRPEDEFVILSSSTDAPNNVQSPDRFEFSINLLAHNSKDDLMRCIQSICSHAQHRQLELVIIDNGSTDETLSYLEHLARGGDLETEQGQRIALQVLFADHNMGFAAGRNATMRASRGHCIILVDTSIEVTGDIWTPLETVLEDRTVGVAGPYGLVTTDLRDFQEAAGPDVDAIEGYLMAFRRDMLSEIGWIDEKFRFYRLMDIYMSFFIKAAGYRAVTVPEVATSVEKHPHREWYSLSEDEQTTKSKKNYDIFRDRWHHGESLLVANYDAQNLWRGHDHAHHLEGTHTHTDAELPAPGTSHVHTHQHWPDHSHEHVHYHN